MTGIGLVGNSNALRVSYVVLIALVSLVTLWLRALRWKYLFPSEVVLEGDKLFKSMLVGFFASSVLPLRAGEFVRPFMLSKWQNVSFSMGFATVVAERVFDILALLVMLVCCLFTMTEVPEVVSHGAVVLSAIAFAIVLMMFCAYARPDALLAVASRVLGLLPARLSPLSEKLLAMLEEFVTGLRVIGSFKELACIISYSLLIWLTIGLLYQCGLYAFGHFPPFVVGLTTSVFVAFAVAVPSAPGFVGTFQFGCNLALSTVFGYSEEFALAYSVLLHVIQTVVCVLGGMYALYSEDLEIRDMLVDQSSSSATS